MYRLYYIVVQSWSKDGQKIGINKPKQTEMRNGESFLTQYVFNVQTWFFFHCQIARNFTGSRLLPQSQTSIPKVHGVWSFCFVWKPHITAFFVHYISHASIVYIYISDNGQHIRQIFQWPAIPDISRCLTDQLLLQLLLLFLFQNLIPSRCWVSELSAWVDSCKNERVKLPFRMTIPDPRTQSPWTRTRWEVGV